MVHPHTGRLSGEEVVSSKQGQDEAAIERAGSMENGRFPSFKRDSIMSHWSSTVGQSVLL